MNTCCCDPENEDSDVNDSGIKDSTYENIVASIAYHEGLSLKLYEDTVGKKSVGYGRNIEDRGIYKDEAELMLKNDLKITIKELQSLGLLEDLSENRKEVLINMCYNLGLPKFKRFKKMIAALQIGDYAIAAKEMLNSKWAKQVGRRAVQLSDAMHFNITLEDAITSYERSESRKSAKYRIQGNAW